MQKTNLKAKGVPNKHRLKAYDHAWQAVGLEFASFVGKNKCVALKAHETRFTAPMSSLLGTLQSKLVARCAAVSRIRAVASRALKRCGATRDEYWSMSRILALSASHRGHFLFAHCKFRGCHFLDPLHRLHDHNNAVTASGHASMKTERIIV